MTLPSKSLEETEQWSGAFGPLAVMQQAGILPHVLIRFVAINARDEDKQFLVVDLVLACWYLCIRMAANSRYQFLLLVMPMLAVAPAV